jgi:hypothetical protein
MEGKCFQSKSAEVIREHGVFSHIARYARCAPLRIDLKSPKGSAGRTAIARRSTVRPAATTALTREGAAKRVRMPQTYGGPRPVRTRTHSGGWMRSRAQHGLSALARHAGPGRLASRKPEIGGTRGEKIPSCEDAADECGVSGRRGSATPCRSGRPHCWIDPFSACSLQIRSPPIRCVARAVVRGNFNAALLHGG